MKVSDRKELVRCVQNHAALDTIRDELKKLKFTLAVDNDAVDRIAGTVNVLISKTMHDSDQYTGES